MERKISMPSKWLVPYLKFNHSFAPSRQSYTRADVMTQYRELSNEPSAVRIRHTHCSFYCTGAKQQYTTPDFTSQRRTAPTACTSRRRSAGSGRTSARCGRCRTAPRNRRRIRIPRCGWRCAFGAMCRGRYPCQDSGT